MMPRNPESRILVILGSSRSRGNTRMVVDAAFPESQRRLFDLARHAFSEYDYTHANRDDAFAQLADVLASHQCVVLATPVYWYTMSATMKRFVDRFSDLVTIRKSLGRALAGRRLYLVATREPLNNSARSAFQSEKPQIVWCEPSDSSHRYGRGSQRARCGFSGETLTGRLFAGAPPRLSSLIWNNQTAIAQAKPEPPAKAPSRPRRVIQRFPSTDPTLPAGFEPTFQSTAKYLDMVWGGCLHACFERDLQITSAAEIAACDFGRCVAQGRFAGEIECC